jgi:hypothetical protein
MAHALEGACSPASTREVGEWVTRFAAAAISARSELVTQVEKTATADPFFLTSHSPHFVGPPTPQSFPLDMIGPQSGTLPSQVTSMAATADAEARPPARKSTFVVVLAGFALLAVIGGSLGIFAVVRSQSTKTATAASATASGPPAASDTAPIAATSSTAEAKPAETVTASAPPNPTTTAPTAPTATVVVAGNAHKPSPVAKPAAAPKPEPPKPEAKKPEPAKPAVDCENPFYVDANGMKRPKPACFGH